MDWLEVRITVGDLRFAEAAADAIRGFVSGGVVIQAADVENLPDGTGKKLGPFTVSGFFLLDQNFETIKQNIQAALHNLQISAPPSFTPLETTNWVDAWKKNYHPIPVGKKLIVLPSWEENPEPGRLPIFIEPGMAFGTGAHETTQLALALLEWTIENLYVDGEKAKGLIDIGCGSGILTIAASRLGIANLVGVDVDLAAVDSARENARLNGVPTIEWGAGSIAEILEGKFKLQQAPVVVANIIAPILIKLLEGGMARTVSKGGTLILSGLLAEQESELASVVENCGLKIVKRKQRGEWVGLICKNVMQ